eukprot:3068816-Rhodomonas_salina.1
MSGCSDKACGAGSESRSGLPKQGAQRRHRSKLPLIAARLTLITNACKGVVYVDGTDLRNAAAPRNPTRETAISVQIVPGMRFLVSDFGVDQAVHGVKIRRTVRPLVSSQCSVCLRHRSVQRESGPTRVCWYPSLHSLWPRRIQRKVCFGLCRRIGTHRARAGLPLRDGGPRRCERAWLAGDTALRACVWNRTRRSTLSAPLVTCPGKVVAWVCFSSSVLRFEIVAWVVLTSSCQPAHARCNALN